MPQLFNNPNTAKTLLEKGLIRQDQYEKMVPAPEPVIAPVPVASEPAALPVAAPMTTQYDPNTQAPDVVLASDMVSVPEQPIAPVIPQSPIKSTFEKVQKAYEDAAVAGQKEAITNAAFLQQTQLEDQKRIAENLAVKQKEDQFIQDSFSKLYDEVNKSEIKKVDPGRFWANKSTGEKILAAISITLGGLDPRGGNKALDVITSAIDQDIKAQEGAIAEGSAKLEKQAGILSRMQARFQNDQAAREATRLAMLQNAELQLKANAAKYGGADAQAKASEAIGKLQIQQQEAQMKFAEAMRSQMALSADPTTINPALLPKEQRELLVPGFGMALTKEDASELKKMNSEVTAAKASVDELLDINENMGVFSSLNPFNTDKARAESLSSQLQGTLKNLLTGGGAISEGDRKFLQGVIVNPGSFFTLASKNKAKLEELKSTMDRTFAANLKARNIQTPDEKIAQKKKAAGIVTTSMEK